jgi:DNA modification methylase
MKHPTQKPYKLTEKLILAAKPQDNCFVVIPFGGSGAEGVACKRLGVDFMMLKL